jgi:L-rhamnose mutarotase
VRPGFEAEYKKRHNPIWPELEATLKQHGVLSYSIFLHPETRQLFAYVEVEDEAKWDAVAETSICRRWWIYMKELMPSNPDDSPVSEELREIFHLEKT